LFKNCLKGKKSRKIMLIISPLDITLCTSNTNLNIVIHHDVTSLYRTTDLQL
jgi:hypothetical protein